MRRDSSAPGTIRDFDPDGIRIAILVARFNQDITEELLSGARAALEDHGVPEDATDVFQVPGAWELPQAASRVVASGRHDAVIALGCVIRGETPHFDFVSAEAARGLGEVALSAPVPVTFGVLTTETLAQARERADRTDQDKGREAVLAALEMIVLYRRIESPRPDGEA